MQHQRSASAAWGENKSDIRVLEKAWSVCTFQGNAEVCAAHREGIRGSKEGHDEWPRGLAEAKASSVGKNTARARGDQEDNEKQARNRAERKSSLHHIPIPRMYMGWVKIQTAKA